MASVTSKPPIPATRRTHAIAAGRCACPAARHCFSAASARTPAGTSAATSTPCGSRPMVPPPEVSNGPLIVVTNHPSWWDPLVLVMLTERMPPWRTHFAPDRGAGALPSTRSWNGSGSTASRPGTVRGSLAFLRQSLAILVAPESTLWITAQGEFVDPPRPADPAQAGNRPPGPSPVARARSSRWPSSIRSGTTAAPKPWHASVRPSLISSSGRSSPAAWTARIEQALEADPGPARRAGPTARCLGIHHR